MELDELAALRAEFKARGYHRKATGRIVAELAFHLTVALGGMAAFVMLESIPLRIVAMIVSTLGTAGVSTNTHTSSHNATSDKKWVNEVLTHFGYPFFVAISATYWRNAHVVIHHPVPNVIGADEDADFQPFFASTDREVREARGWRRTYYRYQWILFPLIVWTHVFLRQRAGVKYLLGALRDPRRRRAAHGWDLLALSCHVAAFWVVPTLWFPLTHVVAFNVLRILTLGFPTFCVLAPGHYPADAGVVAKGDWAKDFVLLQTATTANFRTGWYGRLLCSGLEYQIEHHLFPGYSHVHYPAMSEAVEALCKRNGYPYHSLGWAEAVWKTFMIFKYPKVVQPDLDSFREAREQLREHRAA